MSEQERRCRSDLHALLHGTLLRRKRVCGKSNCRCTRGEKHESLYVVVTENGKPRQLYVPKDWEQTVEGWIEAYQKARELMDEVSRIHWQKVRERRE